MIRDILEVATPLDLRELLESVQRFERHDGRLALVKVSPHGWMVYLASTSWNLLCDPRQEPEQFSDFVQALKIFMELDETLDEIADPREAARQVLIHIVSEFT